MTLADLKTSPSKSKSGSPKKGKSLAELKKDLKKKAREKKKREKKKLAKKASALKAQKAGSPKKKVGNLVTIH